MKLNFPNLTLTEGLSQTWHIFWCNEYYWPDFIPFTLIFDVTEQFSVETTFFCENGSRKWRSFPNEFWLFKFPFEKHPKNIENFELIVTKKRKIFAFFIKLMFQGWDNTISRWKWNKKFWNFQNFEIHSNYLQGLPIDFSVNLSTNISHKMSCWWRS